jgi:hypothetical protein
MFTKSIAAAAALLFCAQVTWAQTASPTRKAPLPDDETSAVQSPVVSLVGTWKANTEKLPLTGDFNEKVWGRNAQSVRDVTLDVRQNGEATLTVSRKVLDARGRVVPGSASVEEAELTVGPASPALATRMAHEVKVVKAQRRYPDAPGDTWALQNLRVNVVSFTDGANTIEVRFEPADGQGAFTELVSRSRTSQPTNRKSRAAAGKS